MCYNIKSFGDVMEKKRLIIVILFIVVFMVLIGASILYYNNKYYVRFDTGTDEIILTKYVNKNDKIKKPIEPNKEGYVFKEWQLNGNTYDFDTEIKNDMVLTAKWIKEEYITINFNTNSSYNIESIKILKGETIKELPISSKENFEFIGWYLDNKLYTPSEIYSDITLDAEYKNDKINTTYKQGDKVYIIGSYSNSAYSLSANYDIAKGWDREIIAIIENGEFPYMIGNEYGVTGFCKANSIEIIK